MNNIGLDWQKFLDAQNNQFDPNYKDVHHSNSQPNKILNEERCSFGDNVRSASGEYEQDTEDPIFSHNATGEYGRFPNDLFTVMMSKTPEQIEANIQPLYISTRTKIFYLNISEFDVANVFWQLPVIHYHEPVSGIVKKQMTVKLRSKEEVTEYNHTCETFTVNTYHQERTIKEVTNDNVNARRNQFKIERIVSVGVSKKDIMNCHAKEKKAFINCFALTYRIWSKVMQRFCELHMKIFSTGKITIPGIIDSYDILDDLQAHIVNILKPLVPAPVTGELAFLPEDKLPMKRCIINNKRGGKLPTVTIVAKDRNGAPPTTTTSTETETAKATASETATTTAKETGTDTNTATAPGVKSKANKKMVVYTPTLPDILINSNFNCGFHILQSRFDEILSTKYNLTTLHNDMNYPGIKCYYYINNRLPLDLSCQTGQVHPNDYALNPIEFIEKYTKVTFISFRTGRALILGSFSKRILLYMYEFVKSVLVAEYHNICDIYGTDTVITKPKVTKPRRRILYMTPEYKDYLATLLCTTNV
jgi:hypothetical protein